MAVIFKNNSIGTSIKYLKPTRKNEYLGFFKNLLDNSRKPAISKGLIAIDSYFSKYINEPVIWSEAIVHDFFKDSGSSHWESALKEMYPKMDISKYSSRIAGMALYEYLVGCGIDWYLDDLNIEGITEKFEFKRYYR